MRSASRSASRRDGSGPHEGEDPPPARDGSRRAPAGEDEASATSVEQATTLIRQAIVSGRYGPGERIKITEAAERFGVSAMPVREALRKLEGEGIVSITPNRGATVRAVDRKFIEDVFEVRTTLEIMILGRCIEGMTLNKLKRLEELLAHHQHSAEVGDIPGTIISIRMIHTALFEFGGNLEAARLFQRGWDTILALRLRFGYSQERLDTMALEFRQLIDALRRRDAKEAEAIIRMHNRAGMDELLVKLSEAKASPKSSE
jgi:DNA-binding GntR family transcriptional regulator